MRSQTGQRRAVPLSQADFGCFRACFCFQTRGPDPLRGGGRAPTDREIKTGRPRQTEKRNRRANAARASRHIQMVADSASSAASTALPWRVDARGEPERLASPTCCGCGPLAARRAEHTRHCTPGETIMHADILGLYTVLWRSTVRSHTEPDRVVVDVYCICVTVPSLGIVVDESRMAADGAGFLLTSRRVE